MALGIYARVLQALRLDHDLASIAADDALGRKLQDAGLGPRQRAPKQSKPAKRLDEDQSRTAAKKLEDLS